MSWYCAARVGYFNIGIDLKTENGEPQILREAVNKVFSDKSYKQNIVKMHEGFSKYDSLKLPEKYILKLN